ncbi:TIR domain-containing protein [Saccharopolyspora gloriosae]|uniref:TIR domain-containing protein n=1 Tax=Saccharopolyspora gloriosae TaxID=455344 RepID=UPI001FB6A76D|nr:TIR domain-containing protein [Saccharopolyspora gloriosae]
MVAIDVFVSYANDDSRWAEGLAEQLRDRGLEVYFDEWHLLPGDLVVHQLERAFRESHSGIAVISPASESSASARGEYAALYQESVRRGLRLIPVLIGGATPPPFAGTRVSLDFSGVGGAAYGEEVDRLAAAIKERPAARAQVRRAVVVCYAPADQEYGRRLVEQLEAAGLPTWSEADLLLGDEHFPAIRNQLRDSIAIVVLMSQESQDSDHITRMILEGQIHHRPFVPVLLRGRRNYHLANTWYLDARDGRLPATRDLAVLHRLHDAATAETSADSTTMPPAPPPNRRAPAVRVPAATSLGLLDRYLTDRELEYADLLTTTVLLDAAARLEDGWLRRADGRTLPLDLLTAIDELWAGHTRGTQGFTAQRGQAEVRRSADFLRASLAYGWRASDREPISRYQPGFTERAGPGGRDGFFPTLRNPQNEHFQDWYEQWTLTVTAVHLRLRDQSGT